MDRQIINSSVAVSCILATTTLWPLYRTTCVSRHPQLKTAGFYWSEVSPLTCPDGN